MKVLVVGCGYAGKRFARTCSYLRRTGDSALSGLAVCDTNPECLVGVDDGWKTYRNLEQALSDFRPQVVVVAVNEFAHYEVLKVIAAFDPAILVLSEKPLTDSYECSLHLSKSWPSANLFVNLVERFSPIIETFSSWREAHPEYKLARVRALWGKSRLNDPRPTMGVLSELIHPLDLVRYLFGLDDILVCSAVASYSDFSVSGSRVLDSVDVSLASGDVPLSIQSSFLWSGRARTVSALFASGDSCSRESFFVDFHFDSPEWDSDHLRIIRVDGKTGKRVVEHSHSVDSSNFPSELKHVFKVSEFVRLGLASLNQQCPDRRLVTLSEALQLEEILCRIEACAVRESQVFAQRLFPVSDHAVWRNARVEEYGMNQKIA